VLYAVNRLIVGICALVVLAGAVITLLVAVGAASADVLPHDWFLSPLQRVANTSGGSAAAVVVVCLVLMLGTVTVLVLELLRPRRQGRLLLSSTEEGVATIEGESVRILAEKTAATAPNVDRARCELGTTSEGLMFVCLAKARMGSNVAEVGSAIQTRVKDAIEQLIGLPVSFIDVMIRYEPTDQKRPPVL